LIAAPRPALSSFVRLALVLELALYLTLGAWLHSRGVATVAIVAGALAFALGGRFLWLLTSMAIAAHCDRPRETRPTWGGVLRVAIGEYRAVLANNFFYLPFDGIAARPDPEPTPGERTPIILVHGYFSSRGYFRELLRFLDAQGIGPVFAPRFPGAFATIEEFADVLDAEIERIARGTGREQVILVCHSMGGLAARCYLARKGAARVAKLITIASPHAGTGLAPYGLGANAPQMRVDSAFLAGLARAEAGKAPCATTSIYSTGDNLVSPRGSSRLAWARNVALADQGHVALLSSPELHRRLLEELR
jgi:triacylglycerol esterase/lipase EstA (alpha/beta hydrolase family)